MWMGEWVGLLILIYLLTAVGLTLGGNSVVHIYTQTIHRMTKKTIHRTTQKQIHRTTQKNMSVGR
jgi:hypothetical protein